MLGRVGSIQPSAKKASQPQPEGVPSERALGQSADAFLAEDPVVRSRCAVGGEGWRGIVGVGIK